MIKKLIELLLDTTTSSATITVSQKDDIVSVLVQKHKKDNKIRPFVISGPIDTLNDVFETHIKNYTGSLSKITEVKTNITEVENDISKENEKPEPKASKIVKAKAEPKAKEPSFKDLIIHADDLFASKSYEDALKGYVQAASKAVGEKQMKNAQDGIDKSNKWIKAIEAMNTPTGDDKPVETNKEIVDQPFFDDSQETPIGESMEDSIDEPVVEMNDEDFDLPI